MKKKTLVSILAMTSVSMGAYADANVDQIKDGAVTDWSGASDLKFENDIFVSPNGTAISQNIGKLVAGTYKLTATTNNAKLLVNGKALDANNQFVLTAETEVTITVSAVTAGQEFQVSGFNLDLVYNFTNARNTLTVELAKATIKQLAEHDVVFWEKHGILAVGEDLIECFDAIDTLSKSAQIFFSARMASGEDPVGMTQQQLDDLVPAFGL